jgi:cyanophycinase
MGVAGLWEGGRMAIVGRDGGAGDESGPLALVGGQEWSAGCDFDAELLGVTASNRVVVLPTAAAFEQPERQVLRAAEWFGALGAEVEGLMVLSRSDAQDAGAAAIVGAADFVYLSGGSALHLRSVLKGSAVLEAIGAAWARGAVVAAAGAAATVLTDPMVDPRGGALTVGLGLVSGFTVFPLADVDAGTDGGGRGVDAAGGAGEGEKLHRAVVLAPGGMPVIGIPGRTAVICERRRWRSAGVGKPVVYVDGVAVSSGLQVLDAR